MELFKKIVKTATFRHSLVSFAGTFLTGILGLVFYVYIARALGPDKFGLFSLSVTTIALVSSIANFGSDTGVLRFVSRDRNKEPQKALAIMKLAFIQKSIVWIVVGIGGFLLMPTIVLTFFGKSELIAPFRVALFGVGATLLSSFSLAALQAYSKFTWWGITSVMGNVVRLSGVILLGLAGLLGVEATLWIYGGSLVVIFLFNVIFLIPNFLKAKVPSVLRKEFFSFNKWVSVFTGVSAVGSRVDTYLSARFLSLTNIGAYSVGTSLVSFVTQIVLALGSVVAPKLSEMNEKKAAIFYLKKLQLFVLFLGILGLCIGIPLGRIFIPIIYGKEYLGSVLPFSILLVGQAIFLISTPVHMAVIYYFSYPKLFVYVTSIRLVLTFVLGLVLIPRFGVAGAAITSLSGNISDLLIPAIWVIKKFKK